MKLKTLKIGKRGDNGWESPEIPFAPHITQLSGENGSGKTPMIQALVFCLGYPVTFRSDVVAHCRSISLAVEVNGIEYRLERDIDPTFNLSVESLNGRQRFEDERSFSEFFFSLLGLAPVNLTDTNNRKTTPYMATALPIFFLDQDIGYSDIYKSPNTFIKDQFQEMVRFLFRFSQKNLFEAAKDLIQLKSRRDTLDEIVASHRKVLGNLHAKRPSTQTEQELVSLLADKQRRLEELRSSNGARSEAATAFDGAIYETERSLASLANEHNELSLRVDSFRAIRAEIETEINTLSLNERAKRLFESAADICANEQCGLFKRASESYGKSLLYLKDQVKDLEASADGAHQRMQILQGAMQSSRSQLASLKKTRSELETNVQVAGLVDAIKETTRAILTTEEELALVRQITGLSQRLEEVELERAAIVERIESISSRGRAIDVQMLGLRVKLRELVLKWLEVLQTENVTPTVNIDPDLRFSFGPEPIKAFKGSTRVRIVLAVHAALFEAYLATPGEKLSCLMFDTPNQQEIHVDDLHRFMLQLKKLCVERDAQIVFTSKDYHYPAKQTTNDVLIFPQFPGPKHEMYLG